MNTPPDSGFDDPSNGEQLGPNWSLDAGDASMIKPEGGFSVGPDPEIPNRRPNYNLPPAWLGKPDTIVGANSIDLTERLQLKRQAAEASFAAEQPPVWRGMFVLLAILGALAGMVVLGFIIFSK